MREKDKKTEENSNERADESPRIYGPFRSLLIYQRERLRVAKAVVGGDCDVEAEGASPQRGKLRKQQKGGKRRGETGRRVNKQGRGESRKQRAEQSPRSQTFPLVRRQAS